MLNKARGGYEHVPIFYSSAGPGTSWPFCLSEGLDDGTARIYCAIGASAKPWTIGDSMFVHAARVDLRHA